MSLLESRTGPNLRAVRILVGAYMALSLATVVAIVLLSSHWPDQVSPQAWTRGVIVAATSVLTFVFARRASSDQPRTMLRLRIVLFVILAAVVLVLFFLSLPTWMVIEQAACGVLLLISTILVVSGRSGASR
jgi:hypothetical protein